MGKLCVGNTFLKFKMYDSGIHLYSYNYLIIKLDG